MGSTKIRLSAACAAALLVASAAACSKNGSGSSSAPAAGTSGAAGSSAPAALAGSITFNQDNLAKLDAALKSALAGKDLSGVNIAMVVNVAADYWKAGQVGFQKGCSDLGLSGSKCTYFAPPNGKLTEQNSEMETLRSQGVTGYAISAIDPTSAAGTIHTDVQHGISVLAIDSPLPGTDAASLYLGTPNYTAGQQAGEAMKQVLGGKGKVAVLVGSLTAANATQRIQGFEDALKGSGVTVVQKVNDNLQAATATSDAETILANNPDVNGLYGVYSYDGPAASVAVKAKGDTGKIHVVADDNEPGTITGLKNGTISASIIQQPFMQGYLGTYITAAMKVLGPAKTAALIKPFETGGQISTGVGTLTKANLAQDVAYNKTISGF